MASGNVGEPAGGELHSQSDIRPSARGLLHGRRLNAIVGGAVHLDDEYRGGCGNGKLPLQIAWPNRVARSGEEAVSVAGGFADGLMSEVRDSAAGRRVIILRSGRVGE